MLAVLGRIARELMRLKAWWLFGHSQIHVFGNFTAINPRNIRMGRDVAINHGVFLLGRTGITIGDRVVLSARCMMFDTSLEPESVVAGAPVYRDAPIVVEDEAWIGAGSIILSGVTVGRKSVVGAGSVVTRDVAPGTVVAGNPARVIRESKLE
ncbi:MAG TPA: acyltransferase [Sphingomicrobium sp.]